MAGSAYTYTYATMGRFLAWIIGWNLVLEYLAAASTVAVGWSGYFSDFMASIRHADPRGCSPARPSRERFRHIVATGRIFNLPAVALVALVTIVPGRRRQDLSAKFNNVMVAIKLTIVLVVIFVGFRYIVPANHDALHPAQHRHLRPVRLDAACSAPPA